MHADHLQCHVLLPPICTSGIQHVLCINHILLYWLNSPCVATQRAILYYIGKKKFFFEKSGYAALIYNKRELATTITCTRSAPPHSLGYKGYRNISKRIITHWDFAQLWGASESSLPLKTTAGTNPSSPRIRVCSPLLQSLNITAFLCFQMLHRVKIAKLWPWFLRRCDVLWRWGYAWMPRRLLGDA